MPGQGQIRVLIQHSGAVSNFFENSIVIKDEFEALRTLEEEKTGSKNIARGHLSELGCSFILRKAKDLGFSQTPRSFTRFPTLLHFSAARTSTFDSDNFSY